MSDMDVRAMLNRIGDAEHWNPRLPEASELEALQRLLALTKTDHPSTEIVSAFLLGWLNGEVFGFFDVTTMWDITPDVAADVLSVLQLIALSRIYPESPLLPAGVAQAFQSLVMRHHPELVM